jgi:hypothetical protein
VLGGKATEQLFAYAPLIHELHPAAHFKVVWQPPRLASFERWLAPHE